MGILLEPISENEFNRLVDIRFSNISEGFSRYINGILELKDNDNIHKEDEFIKFISDAFERNNKEVIVDFYLKNLKPEELKNLIKALNEEDKKIFEDYFKDMAKESIYFRVKSKSLIPFITRLSTQELLFSTFYFLKIPMTLWGNFNFKFPIFTKSKEELDFYKALLKREKLKISNININ